MFGWRRRSEGYEWREYVRTTVLVRRADRQRRIDDVRVAAVNKVKDTADRGVAAGRASVESAAQTSGQILKAVARAAFQTIKGVAVTTFQIIKAAAAVVLEAVSGIIGALWRAAREGGSAIIKRLPAFPRPNLSFPRITALSDAGTAASNDRPMRPDAGVRWPISRNMLGGAALVLALVVMIGPMLNSESTFTSAQFVPQVAASREAPRTAVVETGAITKDPSIITGRARAIRGDLLRINGRLVQLAGIETPEPAQSCRTQTGKNWNCGTSARQELGTIVRRKSVVCTPSGESGAGTILAKCTIGDIDIAATLVGNGHVFAASGIFASYGAMEVDARAAGLGIWQGDNKRPEAWRTEVWEEAKRAAPDRCPIKGRVSGRVYVMPWSQDYGSSRMRTVRGDRWFCTEEEAQAAGFKAAQRS
jgi:endonuclease YncB( thermonuclease family)